MLSWQHHGLKASSRISGYLLGEDIGTNAKLSPMCAALGISQFLKLDKKSLIAAPVLKKSVMRFQLWRR